MTDRDLLELAAKAAGLDVYWGHASHKMLWRDKTQGNEYPEPVEWNPLTNDGDALRLVVRLRLDCLFDGHDSPNAHIEVVANLSWSGEPQTQPWAAESMKADPYAATRRAIVRAAAEIGRTMP